MAVNYAPPPEIIEEVEYPASDGKPMGETGFHIKLIVYVISLLETYFRHRSDVYVGGDMFVYYEEGDPRRCFAPGCLRCIWSLQQGTTLVVHLERK